MRALATALVAALLVTCAGAPSERARTSEIPITTSTHPPAVTGGEPILHPDLADALADGFHLVVGRAPFSVRLWLEYADGYTARWDDDGAGDLENGGLARVVKFDRPGVYEPSVTLSATGRAPLTLRGRIVVLGDAPAATLGGRRGVNQDLFRDPATQLAAQLELMRGAGVEWLRIPLRWNVHEPARGTLRWDSFDAVLRQVNDSGLRTLAVLTGTPIWASGASRLVRGVPPDAYAPRDTRDFAAYVHRVVDRYKGLIGAYELMNEPNSPKHWAPKPDVDRFVELLCAGYLAAKYADPSSVVVAGGLNGNGLTLGYEPAEGRDFLKAIYAGPGARCFDVMAIHPFAHPSSDGLRVLQSWVDGARKYMASQGDARELWLTEVGWSTGRSLWGHATIDEESQARWVREVYQDLVGPQKTFWYNFKEQRPDPTDPELQWGLLRYDLRPKPAFRAFTETAGPAGTDATRPPRS